MDVVYTIVLRLIHIFSGVFWAGTTFFMAGFLTPSVQAAGPAGGQVMQQLIARRLSRALAAAAGLTVLSGLLLYLKDSGGLQLAWITTGAGLAFTIGGLAGMTAMFIGLFGARPATERMAAIGQEIQAGGKPPTPEQQAEIRALQAKLAQGAMRTAALLVVALLGMAIARYL
jgi:uncharacterized membrane protein